MGNRYEVWGWTELPHGWDYEEVWRGESLIACLWHALRARKDYGCVRAVLR